MEKRAESELSVHDNNVYAYSVQCGQRRIVLHTSFFENDPHEYTDVVFTGVLAHSFQHVLERNILFDVYEVEIESLVREEADVFKESWQYLWPPIEYRGDLYILLNLMHQQSIRGFQISSSYGLSGWVLAESCERVPVTPHSGES